MIRCEGLVHVYPDGTRALDGIDLAISPGERVAVVGGNGSGKTTLVRHWNGLLRPSLGRVLVDGRPVQGRRVAELARIVGLTFQDPDRQIFTGRCRTEVEFGARCAGLRASALETAVSDALAAMGLSEVAEANPYDLGPTRRRLLGIAAVLAMRTRVVVLDEPTVGQDAPALARIASTVERLAAAGGTVIAISHDMRFVAETFGRVLVLDAGRVALDGTPDEVFAAAAWPDLAATNIEPPLAARLGSRWGLGSTPTEGSLVAAVAAGKQPG